MQHTNTQSSMHAELSTCVTYVYLSEFAVSRRCVTPSAGATHAVRYHVCSQARSVTESFVLRPQNLHLLVGVSMARLSTTDTPCSHISAVHLGMGGRMTVDFKVKRCCSFYLFIIRRFRFFGGGGVDPIPCVSTHRISDPRSGPAQLLPPHVKQRSHPHGVRPQIPDR